MRAGVNETGANESRSQSEQEQMRAGANESRRACEQEQMKAGVNESRSE